MRIECPHCEDKAFIRTSQQVTRIIREAKCICSNPECGHTFVILVEAVRTISKPTIPHPSVNLPISLQAQTH